MREVDINRDKLAKNPDILIHLANLVDLFNLSTTLANRVAILDAGAELLGLLDLHLDPFAGCGGSDELHAGPFSPPQPAGTPGKNRLRGGHLSSSSEASAAVKGITLI